MTETSIRIDPRADRERSRTTVMHRMKSEGYGWEDALVELRRMDLLSRRPSETKGQAQHVRWHWFSGRGK